jgi:DNA-binding NtrC family response regulator
MMNEFESQHAGNPVGEIPPDQSGLRRRILLAAEPGDLRQLVVEVLVDAGYRVEVAEDGAAAWAALQQPDGYDLLITDQFLPKLSGVELAKKIHLAQMTLPVIMATKIMPTWEFALHPCLQSVKMLRIPYSNTKLLGMVRNTLSQVSLVRAKIGPESNRQSLPAADRLWPG